MVVLSLVLGVRNDHMALKDLWNVPIGTFRPTTLMPYSCRNIVDAVWFDFFFVFVLNTHSYLPFVRRVVDLRCLISAFLSSSLLNILFALFSCS